MLETHDFLSNAELAQRSFVTPQAANEMVQAMAARGWIDRSPDPDHGRIIRLRLTRSGRATLASAHAAAYAVEQEMLRSLNNQQRRALRATLLNCSNALEHERAIAERGSVP